MNDKILVLASAAKEGGALSILIDCLKDLGDTPFYYTVIVHPRVYNELPVLMNVTYIKLPISSWLERIKFDTFGYPNINYNTFKACINFQNIPARMNINQIIYYHQSLPLTDIYFSPFNKKTLKLFLYKNFYGYFFIWNRKYVKSLIVQSEWVKSAVSKKFDLNIDKITVIPPKLNFIDIKTISEVHGLEGFNVLFYPAGGFHYKNHKVIIEALNYLGVDFLQNKKIKVVFTINKSNCIELYDLITSYKLNQFFDFVGPISRETVYAYLKCANALIFPSKLETYGLPLKEAEKFGINILASDMQYAREVLRGYRHKKFCTANDFKEWGIAISDSVESKINGSVDNFEPPSYLNFSDFIQRTLEK